MGFIDWMFYLHKGEVFLGCKKTNILKGLWKYYIRNTIGCNIRMLILSIQWNIGGIQRKIKKRRLNKRLEKKKKEHHEAYEAQKRERQLLSTIGMH